MVEQKTPDDWGSVESSPTPKSKPRISDEQKQFLSLLTTAVLTLFGFMGCSTLVLNSFLKQQTPAEKQMEAAKQVNDWYPGGSHYACEEDLKKGLRDPGSYNRNGAFMVSKDNGMSKRVFWEFRAKNGFGGYNVSAAACEVSKGNGGSVKAFALPD